MKDDTQALAQKLGITPSQLQRLRHRYTRKHGAKGEERLCATLRAHWEQSRDRRWLLARHPSSYVMDENGERHYGYTENTADAVAQEPEGTPPNEIDSYRASRVAKQQFQAEQMEEIGNLLGACQEIRDAMATLDPKVKAVIGRDVWLVRSKIDALERKLRRKIAA